MKKIFLPLLIIMCLCACSAQGTDNSNPSRTEISNASDFSQSEAANRSIPSEVSNSSQPDQSPENRSQLESESTDQSHDDGTSNSGEETISTQQGLEMLRLELYQRGIVDYRHMKAEPYYEKNIFCESSFGDFDANDLYMYKFQIGEDVGNYMIAAITKDLKCFFLMSQVDGTLYDIRDFPDYIHEGEYSAEAARQELERYLIAETEINLDLYNIYVQGEKIDGGDRYYVMLNGKNTMDWSEHAYEFYISKDLKCIAQITYDETTNEKRFTYLKNDK